MKKNNIKKFSILMAMVMLISTVLFACGSPQGQNPATSTDGQSQQTTTAGSTTEAATSPELSGTLRVLTYSLAVDDSIDPVTGRKILGLKNLFDQFTALHPNVKIQATTAPYDGWQAKFQTALLSKQVDVLYGSFYDNYAQGLILNLKDLIEKKDPDIWDKYIPGVQRHQLIALSPDDIVALPADMECRTVMYDKKIFEDFGVEPLSMDPTPAELMEKCAKVTGKNPKTGKQNYGLFISGTWMANYAIDILNNGFFINKQDDSLKTDFSKTVFTINTPENKQKIEYFLKFIEYCPPGFLTGQGMEKWGGEDNDVAVLLFATGYELKGAQENKLTDRYVATNGIRDEQGRVSYNSPMAWGIAKACENVDAAWEFIKYCSGREGQKFEYENYGLLPSLKEFDFISPDDPYSMNIYKAGAGESRHPYFPPFMIKTFRPWLNSLMTRHTQNQSIDFDKELAEQQKLAEQWAKEQVPLEIKD